MNKIVKTRMEGGATSDGAQGVLGAPGPSRIHPTRMASLPFFGGGGGGPRPPAPGIYPPKIPGVRGLGPGQLRTGVLRPWAEHG